MVVNAIPRLPGNPPDDLLQVGIPDLVRPPATRADDVVVMRRFTTDVGVLPVRQVEALDRTELLENLEGAEDRCPPHTEAAAPSSRDELSGGEVALLIGNQHGQRSSWLGQPVAGTVKRVNDRRRVSHPRTVPQMRSSLN